MDKLPQAPNAVYDEPPPPYQHEHFQPVPGQLPNAPPPMAYYPTPLPPSFPPPYSVQQGTFSATIPNRTTVIVTTNARSLLLAPHPVNTQCPHCHAQIMTQITTSAGALAWLICAIIFFFGCWLGCCLIPFCVSSFHDVEHRCPQCKSYLGVYRRL